MWSKRIAKLGLILCGGIAVATIILLATGQDMATSLMIRVCIVVPFVALWSIREIRKN